MIRPRFTVRTLVIFVTFVCAYFAAWEATKRHIIENDLQFSGSSMPLVIWRAEETRVNRTGMTARFSYSVWLFRTSIKLPFKSDWKNWNGPNPFNTPKKTPSLYDLAVTFRLGNASFVPVLDSGPSSPSSKIRGVDWRSSESCG